MWSVPHYVSLVVALAFAVALIVRRLGPPAPMSWLDAVMGACAVGAFASEFGAIPAVAAGGIVGMAALSRWRITPRLALVLAAVALLGFESPAAFAALIPLVAAIPLGERPAGRDRDFNPVVLAGVLVFAAIGLGLLLFGQFDDIAPVVVALAAITVVAGMARAGFTVRQRLRESAKQAVTDDLTGLGNRRRLLDRLERAISVARRDRDEVALLLIDLDGFRELNDTLGHHAGDEVLRQIGPRLLPALRAQDTLARLGGDEFAVVLHPGDETEASATGLRLRAALEESFTVGGLRLHIDASIGIAMFPTHARDPLGLLQRADVAMYEAKRTRAGHEVYLPARDRHSRERLELLGELRDALGADELVLHYQPKAAIATGSVQGVEALVRWAHPRRGLLAPADFLPLAEQSGLGRALTAFVLERAMAEIGTSGLDLTVAVNLGPADLLDLGLPSEVDRLLRRHAFPPEQLRLEVSEDVLMADPDRTLGVLAGLREIGVATALDDFGAGHASLGHLKALRVDELKIDRSFVFRLPRDERDHAIVHSTIDLARRLGMRVVAEGVETAEAWDALALLGCDEAQGYYVSRAMPAEALAEWLGDRARQTLS